MAHRFRAGAALLAPQRMALLGALLIGVSACSASGTRESFDGTSGGPGDGGVDLLDGGSGDGDTPPAQPSKPGCAQSAYTETLPTAASLSGLAFSSGQAQQYVVSALGLRFPLGKYVLEGGLTSPIAAQQGNCVTRFLGDKSSAQAVLRQAPTLVHECGHFFDLGAASGASSAFVVRDDLEFTCKSGDTTSRNGKTFARSRLRTDAFYAKRQACGGQAAQGCDIYADVYLDGSPDDATFQGGDQGFNSVLEETNQYVNSLATALTFKEVYAGSKASERDGILTFLWYVERYLLMAREDYASAYELLSTDPCWRQATLSIWDRAWFYLDATKGMANLGIDDAAIEALVKDPALVAEIDALRRLECK